MSLLVVGVSHRTAPVPVLEQVALAADSVDKLLLDVADSSSVAEALVVSTCNRVEIYVESTKFHPAVDAVTDQLLRHTGCEPEQLKAHLYVHYEDRAVSHLFAVAAGLDSMVVGEGQILGQVRAALSAAQQRGTAGRVLNDVVQNALRVGKRAHTETGIDAAGASIVGVALGLAEHSLPGLSGRRALVVGAGAMASLAATSLQRVGAAVDIANRTPERAQRLAESLGGRAVRIDDLAGALADVDLAVACTGALGHVITEQQVRAAQEARDFAPLMLLDIALPRDIDPAVLGVHGVTLVDLDDLGELLSDGSYEREIESVRRIVAHEVDAYLDSRHADRVTPTVVALRSRASQIVASELTRFDARQSDLDVGARTDVEQLVNRIVDKLLHAPTVRVRELAGEPDGDAYTDALHRLFDLDPRVVEAVVTPDSDEGAR
ncbi:MAG: glutamyl-tRNA reductase [Actinomycetes bacterium]